MPSRVAIDRRRKSRRASPYMRPAVRAPSTTPGNRQAKACPPMSTITTSPPAENASACCRSRSGVDGSTSRTHALGWNGSVASAKTESVCGSTT